MTAEIPSAPEYAFLKGGGEMGALIAAYDWSQTVLGGIPTWPQHLRAAVSMMLKSRFPMLIFWGPALITFYNDAFRPSLGGDGKHPGSLGQRGEESWAESWPVIGPMIYSIMAGGDAVWFEDQKLPLYRDGRMGYAYWTYSFSPLDSGSGTVDGLLVTCAETTKAVEGLEMLTEANQRLEASLEENRLLQEAQQTVHQKVEQSQRQLLLLFEQSPVALATIARDRLTFTSANTFYGELVGRLPEEIIGRPLLEALPELAGQGFDTLLNGVLDTGTAFTSDEVAVDLLRGGSMQKIYVNLAYQPMRDDEGKVNAVLVVATDITAQVSARKKIELSESRFQRLVHNTSVGIILLMGAALRAELVNEAYARIIGHSTGDILHRPIFDVIPDAEAFYRPVIEQVLATGEERYLYNAPYQIRNAAGEPLEGYMTIAYQPYREADGTITGVMIVVYEVMAQTIAINRLNESEARFRSLVERAPIAINLFRGRGIHTIEVANDEMLRTWGKDSSVIGKPLLEALPELTGQPFTDILNAIYETGQPYTGTAMPAQLEVNGVLSTYYFDFTYQPLFNADGDVYAIINMALNVTAQVQARRKVEESEARLRALITSAPVAIGIFLGEDLIVDLPNQAFINVVGKGPDIAGRPLREVMPELAGEGQPFLGILKDVYENGATFRADAAPVKINRDGAMVTDFFNVTFSPLYDASGNIYGILDISVDVTESVKARQQIEESQKALASAIELAQLGTWSIEIGTGAVTYSERLQEWLGVKEATLRPEVLPRVHPADRERISVAIGRALKKDGDGQYDEIYTIINAITGIPRIIHASGRTQYDEDGNAIRLSGTAQDVTMQRDLQAALEQEVQLRTEELAAAIEELQVTNEELGDSNDRLLHSNEELAQYAYVASHDLQEPLRKIQVFSGLLKRDETLSDNSGELVAKISASSERMSLLIRDLLEFSRLLNSDSSYRLTDLSEVVQRVASDFELVIAEKGATLQLGALPVIEAVGLQMNQLFYNLISNSLKFVKPGVPPVISISAGVISGDELARHIRKPMPSAVYYRIRMADNGIGFEHQYADQIFEVFKRLHGRDIYPGSGIGLALCRRIVGNHGGVLYTESAPGEGATFWLILPDRQA